MSRRRKTSLDSYDLILSLNDAIKITNNLIQKALENLEQKANLPSEAHSSKTRRTSH